LLTKKDKKRQKMFEEKNRRNKEEIKKMCEGI
jgi:hypothetical protein